MSLLEPSSPPLQPAARAPSRTSLPPAGPPDQGQDSSSSSPQERFHLGWVGSSPSPTRGSGMRRANGCVVGQIRVRSFLLTVLPPWVRMVEKATLPARRLRGGAHKGAKFPSLPLPPPPPPRPKVCASGSGAPSPAKLAARAESPRPSPGRARDGTGGRKRQRRRPRRRQQQQ